MGKHQEMMKPQRNQKRGRNKEYANFKICNSMRKKVQEELSKTVILLICKG